MEIPLVTLRTETEALCLNIEELTQQLRTTVIAFDAAKHQWQTTYRSKSRILAEAMLSYLPNEDPRLQVEMRTGGVRILKADALECIEAPFYEATAWEQSDTIAKQLRGLMNNVPITTEA